MADHSPGDQIETERQAQATGLSEAEIWLKKIDKAWEEEKDLLPHGP